MPLPPGARVGPYEVTVPLGAGGMGEVYRARDSKLNRDVAIKLLPAEVAADPDRLARLTREAQVLATLNHPNIGAIYGLEDSAGSTALVLELVEGATLADRIGQGPMPEDEAVGVARQIANALEAAHELGIVHRDLKPANIKLRPDGTVKVLDFGLAKAAPPPGGPASDAATVTSPAMTGLGVILGTAAYMAPEQARGLPVDKRADIWAFGTVLFEMLAGRRPFGGERTTDVLAAILKDEASWNDLPATVPANLRALLRRLLAKDPRRRLRDIGDARLTLDEIQDGASGMPGLRDVRSSSLVARALPWALAALASAVAIYLATRTSPHVAPDASALKFTLPISGDSLDRTALPVISPDGRTVAFVKGGSLWVRALDQFEPRQLSGSAGAQYPFWSHDSREIAYLTATALWRVGIDGSSPVRVASYRFAKGGRTPGGVWLADGRIVFAPAARGSGLLTVSEQGGEFTTLYERDAKSEHDLHRPAVLPDGRSILTLVDRVDGGPDTIGVFANGAMKTLLTLKGDTIESPVFSPTGHILYHSEGATPGVWAVAFSPERLEVTGTPFRVAPQGSYPSIGADGTLIYCENAVSGLSELAWLDIKSGAVTTALNERFPLVITPRLSPNGRQVVAVTRSADGGSVIVADLQRQTHLSFPLPQGNPDTSARPTWRDDQTIIYSTPMPGRPEIVIRPSDGSGTASVLTIGSHPHARKDRLVFTRLEAGAAGNLHQLLIPPSGATAGDQVFQALPEHETEASLSPDGTLLVYTQGEAGQSNVVLRTFPASTRQWRVSSNGGSIASWSPTGDAIYYRDVPGQVMRVAVTSRPEVSLSTPAVVPRPPSLVARYGFDVSLDGTKLLMVHEVPVDDQRLPSVAVVRNWFAEFRNRK